MTIMYIQWSYIIIITMEPCKYVYKYNNIIVIYLLYNIMIYNVRTKYAPTYIHMCLMLKAVVLGFAQTGMHIYMHGCTIILCTAIHVLNNCIIYTYTHTIHTHIIQTH